MNQTERLTLRLSPEELAILEQAAALSGMSKSNYLRMLIRGYLPRQTPPEPFQEAMKELRNISGSMAQIARTAQVQGAVDTQEYSAATQRLFAEILTLERAVMLPEKI